MSWMKTPVIWIFFPLALSLLLIFLHRLPKLSAWVTCVGCVLLAATALVFPQSLQFSLFGKNFVFNDTFKIFNRALVLTGAQLKTVAMLYIFCFLWNVSAPRFSLSRWLPAVSLAITALWISTLAVEPFLYASLIVELIVLFSVLILSPRGEKTPGGIRRYLVTQTIAMPFILLSGWMVAGIETAPSASALILRGAMLILIGLSLWLAIFPLHSWLPMLAEKSQPIVFSYIFLMQQTTVLLFLFKVLDHYFWLRSLSGIFQALQWVGVWSLLAGGVLVSLQTRVDRILGYFILIETGYSILAVGLISQGGADALALSFLPRALALLQWSYTLSSVRQMEPDIDGSFASIRGLFYRLPFHSISLIISLLSLVGLPALGLFPAKRMLWNSTASITFAYAPLIAISVGLSLVLVLRLLHNLITTDPDSPSPALTIQRGESVGSIIVLSVFSLLSLLIGLLPHFFLNPFLGILEPFTHLLLQK